MFGGRRFPWSPGVLWVLLSLLMGALISFAAAGAAMENPGTTLDRLDKPTPAVPSQAKAAESFGRLPLHFIANQGQAPQEIKYYAQARGRAVYFTPTGIKFSFLKQAATGGKLARRPRKGKEARKARLSPRTATSLHLSLNPVGMSPRVQITGADPRAGKVNYFRGPDPQKWRTNIPTYGSVSYLGAYPGIDLKFYGTGRQLEYDIIVRPGADPARVKFQYQGIKGLETTREGSLRVLLPDGGYLVQKKPLIYQVIDGVRVHRAGGFKLGSGKNSHCYSFAVASYDKRFPLVIDPVLLYSTYLGGASYDVGNAIAVDKNGNAYITGTTFSDDFPTINYYHWYLSGTSDAFVVKLNAAGTDLVYSTYLGGYGWDEGYGIAVDGDGNAYVTGFTDSSYFPTMNPYQSSRKGASDAFVTKLSAAGNALVYSTYLGDGYEDAGYAMAVDSNGYACVTGETFNLSSLYNVFAARFNPSGALVYRVILTGSYDDAGYGIATDKNGNAYVTGETQSPDFPTTAGALQGNFAGGSDVFVTKLNTGGTVVYSTYLGGGMEDMGYGIAVDSRGSACVTGTTYSNNFPLKNPYQSSQKGNADAFVAKLNTTGTALIYSTYLGQANDDEGYGITVDRTGAAYITGWLSTPVSGSPGIFTADAYVAKFFPSGTRRAYCYLLAGSDDEWGNGIALDYKGNVYLTGETWSRDFPTINPYQGSLNGDADGFVAKIKTTLSVIVPTITPLLAE